MSFNLLALGVFFSSLDFYLLHHKFLLYSSVIRRVSSALRSTSFSLLLIHASLVTASIFNCSASSAFYCLLALNVLLPELNNSSLLLSSASFFRYSSCFKFLIPPLRFVGYQLSYVVFLLSLNFVDVCHVQPTLATRVRGGKILTKYL